MNFFRLQREVQEIQQQMAEKLARLRRLRSQEKALREKASEMIRRGVEDLDELERLETEERQGAEADSLDAAQLPPDMLDTIDWDSLSFSVGFDPLVGESSSANVEH